MWKKKNCSRKWWGGGEAVATPLPHPSFSTALILHISRAQIQKVICFNLKSLTYYFHMKTKIVADFQVCISVPLI